MNRVHKQQKSMSISVNGTLQPISSEWNPWSRIPPYVDNSGQHSQQTERQQAYLPTVGVTQLNAQVNHVHCEVDSGAGWRIMPLCILGSLFREQKPELPTVLFNGYGDSPVKRIKAHAQQYFTLGVRHNRKQYSRSQMQEDTSSLTMKQHNRQDIYTSQG